jgi:hypothetical protein
MVTHRFLPDFLLRFRVDSTTVVRGWLFAVERLTNLPVIALRARPIFFLEPFLAPFPVRRVGIQESP